MKIKKAQRGLCKPSSKRGGGVSCGSSRAPKQDTWKSPRIKFGKDDDSDRVSSGRNPREEVFERDFPGDKAPSGFGGAAAGKKRTRWKTNSKGKMEYAGQSGKNGKKIKAKMGKSVKSKKKK